VGFSRKKHSSNYLIVAVALILAGAFGNIIDSVFYGVILTIATLNWLLFSEQPYGTYFHGKVVDMFFFRFGMETCLIGCLFGVGRFYFLMPFSM
jgi:lipoprotein signal peptidase